MRAHSLFHKNQEPRDAEHTQRIASQCVIIRTSRLHVENLNLFSYYLSHWVVYYLCILLTMDSDYIKGLSAIDFEG